MKGHTICPSWLVLNSEGQRKHSPGSSRTEYTTARRNPQEISAGSVRTETTGARSRLCNASNTSLGIGLGSHQGGEERIPALMEQPSLFPQWDGFPHGRAAAEVLALFNKCATDPPSSSPPPEPTPAIIAL